MRFGWRLGGCLLAVTFLLHGAAHAQAEKGPSVSVGPSARLRGTQNIEAVVIPFQVGEGAVAVRAEFLVITGGKTQLAARRSLLWRDKGPHQGLLLAIIQDGDAVGKKGRLLLSLGVGNASGTLGPEGEAQPGPASEIPKAASPTWTDLPVKVRLRPGQKHLIFLRGSSEVAPRGRGTLAEAVKASSGEPGPLLAVTLEWNLIKAEQ